MFVDIFLELLLADSCGRVDSERVRKPCRHRATCDLWSSISSMYCLGTCCYFNFYTAIRPAAAQVSKPCPNPACLADVTKDGGCDHMRCRACDTHFCWRCLRKMTTETGYFCKCLVAAAPEQPAAAADSESGGDGEGLAAWRRRMAQTSSFDAAAAARFARGLDGRNSYARLLGSGAGQGGGGGPHVVHTEAARRAALALEARRVFSAGLGKYVGRLQALVGNGGDMGERDWAEAMEGGAEEATAEVAVWRVHRMARRRMGAAGQAEGEEVMGEAWVWAQDALLRAEAAEQEWMEAAWLAQRRARMQRLQEGRGEDGEAMLHEELVARAALARAAGEEAAERLEAMLRADLEMAAARTEADATRVTEREAAWDRAVREELRAWAARDGGAAGGGGAALDELAVLYALHAAAEEERSRAEGLAASLQMEGGDDAVVALVKELGLWWRLAANILLHGIGAAAGATYSGQPLAPPLAPLLSNVAVLLANLKLKAESAGALAVLERLGLASSSGAAAEVRAGAAQQVVVSAEPAAAAAADGQGQGGNDAEAAVAGQEMVSGAGANAEILAMEKAVGAPAFADAGAATMPSGSTVTGGAPAQDSAGRAMEVGDSEGPGRKAPAESDASAGVTAEGVEAAAVDVGQDAREQGFTGLSGARSGMAEATATAETAETLAVPAAVAEATAAQRAAGAAAPPRHTAVERALAACGPLCRTELRETLAALLALPAAPAAPQEAVRPVIEAERREGPRMWAAMAGQAAAAAAAELREDRRRVCSERRRGGESAGVGNGI